MAAEIDGVGCNSRRLFSAVNARSVCFAFNEQQLVCEDYSVFDDDLLIRLLSSKVRRTVLFQHPSSKLI